MVKAISRPLVEGPLSVDLVNTIWNKDGEYIDWLATPGALKEFCNDQNVTFASEDEEMVQKALTSSRALIRRLFDAMAGSESENLAVLSSDIDDALASTQVRVHFQDAELHLHNVETRPTFSLATAALLNGLELGQHGPDRLRCCSHDACILWFWDSSRGGRRRWCSMDRCGNRVKAQRHYEKARTSTDE